MFEFKTRPWQCAELSEANSAGGRNSASGRETRKSAFLPSVMPFPPEEAFGTHAAGCHFQLGEGGGIEGHDILGNTHICKTPKFKRLVSNLSSPHLPR